MLREKPVPLEKIKVNAKYRYKLKDVEGVAKGLTLKDFLDMFINKYNRLIYTIYVETGKIQCCPGKWRSIGDITRIAQYYYGDKVTILQVRKLLQELVFENKIATSVCCVIEKRVFKPTIGMFIDKSSFTTKDEYGYDFYQIL